MVCANITSNGNKAVAGRWSRTGLIWLLYYLGWRFAQLVAARRDIKGVAVYAITFDDGRKEECFSRIEAALDLIEHYDPSRWRSVRAVFNSIFVLGNRSILGRCHHRLRMCEISESFVVSKDASPERIASVIVHEAMHAHLLNRGVPYTSELRARIERLCTTAEIAFLKRVPTGGEVLKVLRRRMSWPDELWSEQVAIRRQLDELQRLGTPQWIVRLIEKRVIGRENRGRVIGLASGGRLGQPRADHCA
jgi:hypothetical protein